MSISINLNNKKSSSILDNMPGLISTTAGIDESYIEENLYESHYKDVGGRRKERAVVVFTCQLSEQTEVSFTTQLEGTSLYIQIPQDKEGCFSKQAFVSLLEYAEEKLHCHHIIVCLRKDRPDRAQLAKMFSFLGFTILPPNSHLAPPNTANLYMIFRVEQ